MSKAYIKFDLPEEREDLELALNAWKYKNAIDEVWNNVWRPYYKHGYNNEVLNKLLEDKHCQALFDLLVKEYQRTIKEALDE